jgi:hypothetical protein
MQVLIGVEVVICFNLKYTIDFEEVINTLKKKKLGRFPRLSVDGFPMWMVQTGQVRLSWAYCNGFWAGW